MLNQTLEIFEQEVTISTELQCRFYMLICKARAVADTARCLCDCGSIKPAVNLLSIAWKAYVNLD